MGEEDGKAEQPTKQLPCVTLTLAQNADGSFPVTEKVTRIMNLELIELLDHGKPLDPRAWMTLVCIAFLKTFFEKEKVIWELVVTKAEKWLISSFPNVGESELQKAVEFLKTAKIGKVCPLGHPLRLVPEAARLGQSWHCTVTWRPLVLEVTQVTASTPRSVCGAVTRTGGDPGVRVSVTMTCVETVHCSPVNCLVLVAMIFP